MAGDKFKQRMTVSAMSKQGFGSQKSGSSYSLSKSTSSASKSSPFASKTQYNVNTWQKSTPQATKAQSTVSTGFKSSTSNIPTFKEANSKVPTFKEAASDVPTFKEATAKSNITLTTGQKHSLAAFKTNSNYSVESKGYSHTYKSPPNVTTGIKSAPHNFTNHPNLYTGPENPRPAFQTISRWPTAHPITAPAFKVYPTFNNYPRHYSPAHLLGSWNGAVERERTKDGVLKDQAERGQSLRHSQKNEDDPTTRNQTPASSGPNEERDRAHDNANEIEINCPTCEATFPPKIFQCANGHSSCSNCKEKGWSCGICGQVITDMRNFALEDYLAKKKFLCPHNTEGCELVLNISEIYAHIEECSFRTLECPAGCSYRMPLKQLSIHFDNQHPGQRLIGIGSEVELRYIYEPSQKVYLLEVGAYHFLLHEWVSAQNRQIYMAVQLIGTKPSASKWSYEIQIYAKNEPHRVYTCSESCTSFMEPVVDVFNEGKCCILTQTHAATFLHKAAVTYKVFIKKIAETTPQTEILLINFDD